MAIDAAARVDPSAAIADDVEIGAFSVVGPNVTIDSGTVIGPHTVVSGHTRIGRDNRIAAFVSLGDEPQHRDYAGEPTTLTIGDRNTVREYASIHRGTASEGPDTTIGDDNFIMAYTHIAHDCVLGSGITMANGASLAGHVRIDDHCILSGFALVYQFRQVGTMAFLAYSTGVVKDVPAFVRVAGSPAHPNGINSIGMRRSGYTAADVKAVKQAFRLIYRSNLRLDDARAAIRETPDNPPAVDVMLATLDRAELGIIR